MKSKLFILLALLLTVLMVLTACSSDDDQQQVQQSEEEIKQQEELSEQDVEKEIEEIEEEYEEEAPDEDQESESNYKALSPFTGLPIEEEFYKRAVAVSIENSPASRPQSGLEEAEIVYEFMLEGGITRFLAFFWPEVPEKIGPIRSARPALIETAQAYDALFLHAGASPDGFELLATENILNLDQLYQSKYFWRSSKREAPHNLYTGKEPLEVFLENLPGKEYPEQFDFLTASIISDYEEAENINIDYEGSYDVIYKYNNLENNYLRFIDDDDNPHQTESGAELAAKNVIVQYVKTSTKDDEGRQEIELDAGGKMQLFRDGIIINGSWKNSNGRVSYLDDNGDEIEINPGQTWIQIVSNGTEISY